MQATLMSEHWNWDAFWYLFKDHPLLKDSVIHKQLKSKTQCMTSTYRVSVPVQLLHEIKFYCAGIVAWPLLNVFQIQKMRDLGGGWGGGTCIIETWYKFLTLLKLQLYFFWAVPEKNYIYTAEIYQSVISNGLRCNRSICIDSYSCQQCISW